MLQPRAGIFAHLRLPATLALSRTSLVNSAKIATAPQTPIAREDLAVSFAHGLRGKQCIIRLGSSLLSGSLAPDPLASVCASREWLNFQTSQQFFPLSESRRPENAPQEAWSLVPDGARVLLVEAESKLMELKYRGARAGGRTWRIRTTCSAYRTSARTPTGI